MTLWLVLAALVIWYFGVCTVKELHARGKERWEEGVMARYERAEDARAHRQRLAEIEAVRRRTGEAMVRAAAESDGGNVIDGAVIKIEPR